VVIPVDAQHRTVVRNFAPENLGIPDRRVAPSGMTVEMD
jgi:hypothetical protein